MFFFPILCWLAEVASLADLETLIPLLKKQKTKKPNKTKIKKNTQTLVVVFRNTTLWMHLLATFLQECVALFLQTFPLRDWFVFGSLSQLAFFWFDSRSSVLINQSIITDCRPHSYPNFAGFGGLFCKHRSWSECCVVFHAFPFGGRLRLAMLAGFEPSRPGMFPPAARWWRCRAPGGCVVDGLGNFLLFQSVVFLWIRFSPRVFLFLFFFYSSNDE